MVLNNSINIQDIFGCYTVISGPHLKPKKPRGNYTYFICQCQCGRFVSVNQDRLKRCPKSCIKCLGFHKRKARVGDTYGLLTLVNYIGKQNGMVKILVKCDCGNTFTMNSCRWTQTKSCGCYRKKKGINHWNYTGLTYISGHHLYGIEQNAIKRNIEFSVTAQYLEELFITQQMKCKLSGVPIQFDLKTRTASLDRIDSKLGYIIGNVQWVHKDVNKMKQNFSQNDFINYCKKIANNN